MANSSIEKCNSVEAPGGNVEASCEQTLGAIVMELMQAGQAVTLAHITLRIAVYIEEASDLQQKAHYADVLRLIMSKRAR